MADDDLNTKLKAAADKLIGTKAVMKTGYGKDCFVLVDMLLRQIGAATAADGDVKVTPTADYDWGDGITLGSLQPGDILQFKKHLIHIETQTFNEDDQLIEKGDHWLTRPHHSAIVLQVNSDGSVVVAEQNVHPNPDRVNRNTIPRLEEGVTNSTVREGKNTKKIKMTVTGEVHAYHPTEKPTKGASLIPHGLGGGRYAGIVPSQGGAKRLPGPVGNGTSIG